MKHRGLRSRFLRLRNSDQFSWENDYSRNNHGGHDLG